MTLYVKDENSGEVAPLSTASLVGEHVPRVSMVGGVTITGPVALEVPTTWSGVAVSGAILGDNALITPGSGSRICVVGMMLVAQGDVDVALHSTTGLALTGPISLSADGNGFVWPISARGWWVRTGVNEGLNMNLSAAVVVGGIINYYRE